MQSLSICQIVYANWGHLQELQQSRVAEHWIDQEAASEPACGNTGLLKHSFDYLMQKPISCSGQTVQGSAAAQLEADCACELRTGTLGVARVSC